MSKRSKKAQADAHETASQTAEEARTVEVVQTDVEVVPATMVEATEEQVFTVEPTVANGEAAVTTEDLQNQVVEQPAQAEQPVPKKPRVDKRPYIPWLTSMLEVPQDRKILLKSILEQWPQVSKGGCQTFLTDMLNPKYSFFKDRSVVKLADGKVCFADKAPVASVEEVQEAPAGELATPTEDANEQPAE